MDEFKRKLLALETLYGGRKNAAKKLGVSADTFTKYKRAGIPDSRSNKINRLLGNAANKKKLEERAPILEKKVAAYEKKQNAYKVIATNTWLSNEFGKDLRERFIVHNLTNETPYVAYTNGNKDSVQFFDGITEPGKPPGAMYLTAYGIITQNYYVNDPAQGNFIRTKIPLLSGVTEKWSLQQTIDYAEQIFMAQKVERGRQKFVPTRFIGIKF